MPLGFFDVFGWGVALESLQSSERFDFSRMMIGFPVRWRIVDRNCMVRRQAPHSSRLRLEVGLRLGSLFGESVEYPTSASVVFVTLNPFSTSYTYSDRSACLDCAFSVARGLRRLMRRGKRDVVMVMAGTVS